MNLKINNYQSPQPPEKKSKQTFVIIRKLPYSGGSTSSTSNEDFDENSDDAERDRCVGSCLSNEMIITLGII